MPPLLCPSPLILDHSFPRSDAELRRAARALGSLEEVVSKDEAWVGLTDALRDFVELFDWERTSDQGALLREIYDFCARLFLSPTSGFVNVPIGHDAAAYHPRPADCEDGGLVDYWCEEVGRLFELHEANRRKADPFFIAVACSGLFAHEESPGYANDDPDHEFPLVGPGQLSALADAFVWDVPSDTRQQTITFAEAYKNVRAIGATRVDNPSGGSHFKVRFPGARPWLLDPNVDQIPDRFLKEAGDITGYPTTVIKYALKHGALPPRQLRFSEGSLAAVTSN